MNLPLVLLLLVLLLAIWLVIRLRRSASGESPAQRTSGDGGNSAYHAVSIKVGERACAAAMNMVGRRYLSSASPKLPLPECDVVECTCRFIHHQDRRSGKDRRSPFSPAGYGGGTRSYEADSRSGKDRRTTDDA